VPKENSLQQKACTGANSAGSLGRKSVAAANKAVHSCTMDFSYLSCVLGRAQCVRRQRQPAVIDNRAKQASRPGPCALEELKPQPPHASGAQKIRARLCRNWFIIGFVLGGRQRVQSAAIDDEKPKAYCIAIAMGQGFSGSHKNSERKRGPRQNNFCLEIAEGLHPGGTWEDVQEARYAQARHHCPRVRRWYVVYNSHYRRM